MAGLLSLTRHRAVALVAAGVVAGAAGGAVISQLGTAGAASPSPTPGAHGPFGRGPGHGLLGGPGGRMLHGEATVEKAGGGTSVVHFQNGVISAISGSTMTVKSTDNFTMTYTVDSTTHILLNGADGTLSKLAKNDKVRVVGVEDASATVAKMVVDGVEGPAMFGHGFGRGLAHRFAHKMMAGQAPAQGKAG